MEKLVIKGATRLHGEVTAHGAKNAAVAIIPAALLVDGICNLENVPNISDVKIYCDILEEIGAKVTWTSEHSLTIDSSNILVTYSLYLNLIPVEFSIFGKLLKRISTVVVSLGSKTSILSKRLKNALSLIT